MSGSKIYIYIYITNSSWWGGGVQLGQHVNSWALSVFCCSQHKELHTEVLLACQPWRSHVCRQLLISVQTYKPTTARLWNPGSLLRTEDFVVRVSSRAAFIVLKKKKKTLPHPGSRTLYRRPGWSGRPSVSAPPSLPPTAHTSRPREPVQWLWYGTPPARTHPLLAGEGWDGRGRRKGGR